jgi:lipopolysaccharide biosynthesis regulator YciM
VKEVAHYYCEIASAALAESRFDDASAAIESALAEYKLCVRATMLAGDVALAQGHRAAAIAAWKRVEAQNPAYLALVAERLANTLDQEGERDQSLRLLQSYQQQYPSVDLLNTLFDRTLESEGPKAASDLIKDELRRNPTLLGLDKLLEAQLLSVPAERRHDLELVKGLVHQHTRRLGMYRCEHCGFRAKQYYWRCPGCGKWETYSPRRTESPEGYV